jgi:RNA ligase (TIGR02306 family)
MLMETSKKKSEGLAYVGIILDLVSISGASNICAATVVCGRGGRWRGVVTIQDFRVGDKCLVFLPDSIVPECDRFRFMEKHKWRVKMMKLRGCPSEVLIVPFYGESAEVGEDITELFGVKKYHKPIPAHMDGKVIGEFPGFIPKTDELNYQMHGDLVERLTGNAYYVTEKMDGSSS